MSYRVRSHKFCCCIPVRFGTLVSALLGIALGGVVAIAGVLQFKSNAGIDKNSFGVSIAMYAVLAFLSLFGLIGTLLRKERLVKSYWIALLTHLLFSMGSGAYLIYTLFKSSDATVNECLRRSGEPDSTLNKVACEGAMVALKGVTIGIWVVILLLELWGCIIVRSYVWQLREENNSSDIKRLKASSFS